MSTVNGFQVGNEVLKYNYESLENYNTPNFSTLSSTQYAVGDYVTYQGKLYKCTTATTGGTWVSGSWELAILSDDLQSLGSKVEDLNQQISDIESDIYAEVPALVPIEFTWTDGAYMNGAGVPVPNSSYSYSNKIPVETGDIIVGRLRMLTTYSNETTAIRLQENLYTYIVPENVKYIVVSVETANKESNISKIETEKITKTENELANLKTGRTGESMFRATGSVNANSNLSISNYYIRKGFAISFYGKIESFNDLTISQGSLSGTTNTAKIIITNTSIQLYGAGILRSEIQHGLTITDYIFVLIKINSANGVPSIIITTKDNSFTSEFTDIPWDGAFPYIYAETINSELNNTNLTVINNDIKKDIWYVGDSYFSQGDPSRLPYYLISFGCYDSIANYGFSGADAGRIMNTVLKLFSAKKYPSYLIWAIGMNNGDGSSAINAVWKTFVDALINFCSAVGIELILCTIPNTPTINNRFKNEYIRNSGLRYIEYALAVNESADSNTWISGMLSSDNTHPTASGARLLSSVLINSVTELT